MERPKFGARLALVSLAGIVSLLAAASADADLAAPGPNGQIAFTSGRAEGAKAADNNTAQIWLMNTPGGSATRLSIGDTVQFRHPGWSPDHTKIAYASGPAAGPWEIFVRDLTQPVSATNPRNITNTAGSEDRPAWSPDGTRIAYQGDQGANLDIKVRNADGTSLDTVATNVETAVGAASFYPRPHWTPDSQTIFYARTINATSKHDIYKSPADGTNTAGTPVVTGNSDDFHPYVSPDGTKLCFTRQGANKDVYVASSAGGAGVGTAIDTNAGDDYECAWSPDQTKIIYVRGAASAGQIFMKNSDGSGSVGLPVADDPATFDGNPDWAIKSTVAQPGGGQPGGGKDTKAATIDQVALSRRTWRRGSGLPSVVSRARVGTTISYRLSENARVTLTFSRRARGRKVGRRCRKPTRRNRTRRRCIRYVKAGTLRFNGKAGVNKVRFQGRLSRRKRLALGRYRLVVGAKDAAGNVSKKSKPVSFRIVRR